ncbi:MAG: endonuclease/exonuclease/phosphatase family protein [Paludibacteraceae bacterium]|nr:endonuclease/exonuclease/phosphatase family protein [Paludibacteraceae bacterium]
MKKIGCCLIVVCVAMLVLLSLLLVSHSNPPRAEEVQGKTITILTYNTCRMGQFRKQPYNQVIHYIRRNDADIVCLQEVEVYKDNQYLTLPELRDAMRQYPYTYYDFKLYNSRRQFGNVVYSKYPLINKQTVPYTSQSNISSRCDVVVGGDTLRLFVNHLESNHFTRSDLHIDSLSSEQIKESAQKLSRKLDKARPIRKQQARILRQEIKASPYPIVVVGDFNSIPWSYTYLLIRFGLRDCFLETSRGRLGNTFVKHHLGIRIDYILCSKSLQPVDCRIDKVNYSDHYPVNATIALP